MSETHEYWIERLSDHVDGDLDAPVRDELEAHLASCGSCRRVLEDLRAVVARAGELGELPPARDLWPGIAAAIGAPVPAGTPRGVIPLPTAARPRPRPSGIFLTLPQLAAAAVALAVISVSATLWVGPGMGAAPTRQAAVPAPEGQAVFPAGVAEPSPELSAELAVLEQSLAAARDKLEPNTVRILEKNLGVIERAIDESRRALALDPGNAFLRQHLERAYRDKVEFLRQAASVADWAS